jgi:hypothetical protein
VCKEISKELGFSMIQRLGSGKLRHVAENLQIAQTYVHRAIKEVLMTKCKTLEELTQRLKQKGIECKFKAEKERLTYSTYIYQRIRFKGQDVGFSAKQLWSKLSSNISFDKGLKL